jgi:tetratricopeptide (TPR) repeat protein
MERAMVHEAAALAAELGDAYSMTFADDMSAELSTELTGPGSDDAIRSVISRFESAGRWREAGQAVTFYATLLMRQRRLDDAGAVLRPRMPSAHVYGASEPLLHYQHARLLYMCGDLDGASAGFDDTMRHSLRCGVPLTVGHAWFGKAWVAEARGDLVTARDCLERSLAVVIQFGDRREHLGDRIRLVELSLRLSDVNAARLHSNVIAELARQNPGPRETGYHAYADGLLALTDGTLEVAQAKFLTAIDAFEPARMLDDLSNSLTALLRTLPEPLNETLTAIPDDVRAHRISPAQAVAMILAATPAPPSPAPTPRRSRRADDRAG